MGDGGWGGGGGRPKIVPDRNAYDTGRPDFNRTPRFLDLAAEIVHVSEAEFGAYLRGEMTVRGPRSS